MEKEESPFKTRKAAVWSDGAHYSDFRHYEFLNDFSVPEKPKYPSLVKDVTRPIGVAIFGALGRAGSIHLRNVLNQRRSKLLYLVEERKREGEDLLKQWNVLDVKVVAPKDALVVYKDSSVDMVICSTPTAYHEAIVLSSLNHGKAVFCEKPIAETVEKTRRCYQLAKEKGLPLMSAFNRRFDIGFGSIERRTKAGEIGKVHMVKTCSRDSPLPTIEYLKQSGGIFHDCAIHDIDIICWMLDEFPIEVYVSAKANIPEIADLGDHDTVAIVLTYKSGAIGIVDLSRNSTYGYDQRVEVYGTKGMLLSQNEIPNQVTAFKSDGNTMNPMFYSFPSRYADAYKEELRHFLNVIYGHETLIVKEDQTIAATIVATACEESLQSKRAVQLSWSD